MIFEGSRLEVKGKRQAAGMDSGTKIGAPHYAGFLSGLFSYYLS